jgi:putative flippase GtrA
MLTQFIKFSLVGVLNTAIHYGVFYSLYEFVGLYYVLASGIGFCLAVTNSYFCNKFWTFKRRGSDVRREFMKFFIVNCLTLSINLGSMAILVELFAMHPPVAQLVTIGITLVINFLGNKFWTFKE